MRFEIDCLKPTLEDPVISVIVPVYNGEPYLSACLDSILSQSYRNIEIVIVDDGSTDASGSIADYYFSVYKNKIQVLHQKNTGVSEARRNGIQAARGEWIGFVDADDEIETDMYERLLNNAIDHQAQISHCGYQIVANNGKRVHYFYNTGIIKEQNKEEGIRDLIEGRFVEPSLCNKLFHHSLTKAIFENDKIDLPLRYNEDLMLNYLFFKEADTSIYEDFCPYHYLARNGTATRKGFEIKKYLDPIEVWRYIRKDQAGDNNEVTIRRYLFCCISAYAVLSRYRDKKICTFLKKELLKNHRYWKCLRLPDQLRLILLIISPRIYYLAEKVFVCFFQQKKYE